MKSLFNEAEQFLVGNWSDARLLAEAMDEIREKYRQIGQRIVDAVVAAHAELDFPVICLTQNWAKGYIGIGKKNWPDGGGNSPSGLYVDHLRLELLTSDAEEPPTAYVWLAKSAKVDAALVHSTLLAVAQTDLSSDERQKVKFDQPGEVSFTAPSRDELLAALLKGDGQQFVDLIVQQFDVMARFIPGLDKLLLKAT